MYVLNGFLYNKRKKYLTKKIMKKSKRRRKSGSFEKILTCFSFASCLFIAHTLINDGQVCWHNFRSIFLCMATWYLFGSRNEKKTHWGQNSYQLETKISGKISNSTITQVGGLLSIHTKDISLSLSESEQLLWPL